MNATDAMVIKIVIAKIGSEFVISLLKNRLMKIKEDKKIWNDLNLPIISPIMKELISPIAQKKMDVVTSIALSSISSIVKTSSRSIIIRTCQI